jgi:hypothetical protein
MPKLRLLIVSRLNDDGSIIRAIPIEPISPREWKIRVRDAYMGLYYVHEEDGNRALFESPRKVWVRPVPAPQQARGGAA